MTTGTTRRFLLRIMDFIYGWIPRYYMVGLVVLFVFEVAIALSCPNRYFAPPLFVDTADFSRRCERHDRLQVGLFMLASAWPVSLPALGWEWYKNWHKRRYGSPG